MPELDLPQRQTPDSLMLPGFWYRALPADGVQRNQLHQATLLEIPLVVGRDRQGQPFALRDACPHRGMPLHAGGFDGSSIECSYHGWKFDAHNGRCQLIPSLSGSTFPSPPRKARDSLSRPRLPRPRRKLRNSAPSTSLPTSPPTCPSAWITASSD
jgi:nitrite reductase/ring-hydroxylating ferredoxin subunit